MDEFPLSNNISTHYCISTHTICHTIVWQYSKNKGFFFKNALAGFYVGTISTPFLYKNLRFKVHLESIYNAKVYRLTPKQREAFLVFLDSILE